MSGILFRVGLHWLGFIFTDIYLGQKKVLLLRVNSDICKPVIYLGFIILNILSAAHQTFLFAFD